MKRKVITMMLLAWLLPKTMTAQAPETSASQQEYLDRGFVCINTAATSSFLSWRLLSSDDAHTSFLIMKDGVVVGDTIRNATSIRMASNATTEFQLVTLNNGVPIDIIKPVSFNKTGYHLLQLDRPAAGSN